MFVTHRSLSIVWGDCLWIIAHLVRHRLPLVELHQAFDRAWRVAGPALNAPDTIDTLKEDRVSLPINSSTAAQ